MGMKGHPESQSNCGGGGGGGGGGWMMMKKKKMAMVAVVVLVGLIGVMAVQKVRDRRLFNRVIKDKDRQILSLHLILQKERQYAKENKRKNQDLNTKLYSLRTQKMELNNKLMEMRSTIGSMKDEQQALELAINEKQNDIKRKESEIQDLRRSNLQTPPKIWSVSSDDPSNREVNLTRSPSLSQSGNGLKPRYQVNLVEGMNPEIKVQNPKNEDSILNTKIEMNTTSEENGNGLSFKGRKSFIGGESQSQQDKSEQNVTGSITQPDGQSQPKVTYKVGPTDLKSREREDEDEGEMEGDMNSSNNGAEADQDYKEETE